MIIIIHLAIIIFNKIIRFMSLQLTLFQLFYGFFLNIKFIYFFMHIYTHTCSIIFTFNYIIIINLALFLNEIIFFCEFIPKTVQCTGLRFFFF